MDVESVGVPASHREWRVERGRDPNCKIKAMAAAATSKLAARPSFLTSSGTGCCMGTSHMLTR